jgi:hypothetical protein
MPNYRYFTVEEVKPAVAIRFSEPKPYGDVLAEMLRTELLEVVRSLRPAYLVIDFHGVNMISSSVIGALLLVKRQLE